MKEITQIPGEPRASYLLRVASEFIRTYACQTRNEVVLDDCDADGAVLATACEEEASEILHAAGLPDPTRFATPKNPQPTES